MTSLTCATSTKQPDDTQTEALRSLLEEAEEEEAEEEEEEEEEEE